MINLITDDISESTIKENFQKLSELFKTNPLLGGNFKHIEVTVTNASANYKIYHRLGFRPKDVIITYNSQGTVTPVFSSFTNETIEINASTATTVRLLVGSV